MCVTGLLGTLCQLSSGSKDRYFPMSFFFGGEYVSNTTYSGDKEAVGATPGGVVYPGAAYGEVGTQDGLLVGPAIGRVGELVRDRVTVKLCPSQPLVESLSEKDNVSIIVIYLFHREATDERYARLPLHF